MTFPFEEIVEPESIGMDAGKLNDVISRFKRQHANGAFPGGQLVVRRRGKVAVNVAIGVARGYRDKESISPVEALPQTLFPAYSSGKPLAAVAIAMLEDKGLLDVNTPVADIFPDFGNNGKREITILDVLTHRSGVLLPHLTGKFEVWQNKREIQKQLADAVPVYKRGTLAYQPGEFGWILSEIVSRIDGRELADYIEQEIAASLKLPDLKFSLRDQAYKSIAHSYWLGKDKVMVAGINVADNFEELANDPQFFNSRNPSFTLISNAASISAFYEFLVRGGVTRDGQRLVSEEVLKEYSTRQLFGWDKSVKTFLSLGRGFMTGTLTPSLYGWWNTSQCFGHAGMFSNLAFGDYDTGISVAILTNGNRGIWDFSKRTIPIAHGCRKACL
jgi:CubicO group peptidase (beta-lactamase class C family)